MLLVNVENVVRDFSLPASSILQLQPTSTQCPLGAIHILISDVLSNVHTYVCTLDIHAFIIHAFIHMYVCRYVCLCISFTKSTYSWFYLLYTK